MKTVGLAVATARPTLHSQDPRGPLLKANRPFGQPACNQLHALRGCSLHSQTTAPILTAPFPYAYAYDL